MSYEQPTYPPQDWRPGDGTPAKPVTEKEYLPLYAERRCVICGFWRGQHIGASSKDLEMQCPTTFKPAP